MCLLAAVPAEAPEALQLAEWLPHPHRLQSALLSVSDGRLDRLRMRTYQDGGGREREQDWSTTTETTGGEEWTHSRAYVLGLCVGVLRPGRAVSYGQTGPWSQLTWGYETKLEIPFARPRAQAAE